MKMLLIIALLTAAIPFAAHAQLSPSAVQDSTEDRLGTFPRRIGFVNDYEKILSKPEIDELSKLLYGYKLRSGADMVVVTTKRYDPYHDMGSYAKDLATVWGIQTDYVKIGIVVMLSKKLGEIRIVAGKTAQLKLTDSICEKTIDTAMLPYFEHERYGAGLLHGIKKLITILENP